MQERPPEEPPRAAHSEAQMARVGGEPDTGHAHDDDLRPRQNPVMEERHARTVQKVVVRPDTR